MGIIETGTLASDDAVTAGIAQDGDELIECEMELDWRNVRKTCNLRGMEPGCRMLWTFQDVPGGSEGTWIDEGGFLATVGTVCSALVEYDRFQETSCL